MIASTKKEQIIVHIVIFYIHAVSVPRQHRFISFCFKTWITEAVWQGQALYVTVARLDTLIPPHVWIAVFVYLVPTVIWMTPVKCVRQVTVRISTKKIKISTTHCQENCLLSFGHTWLPRTGAWTRAQNSVAFRHWYSKYPSFIWCPRSRSRPFA